MFSRVFEGVRCIDACCNCGGWMCSNTTLSLSLATEPPGYCSWIIDHLDAVKGILIQRTIKRSFPPSVCAHRVPVCLHTHVLVRVAVCVIIVHNTLFPRVFWHDLPHLENSDSHHCNRLWHCMSSPPRQFARIICIPEHKSKMSSVYHKVRLIDRRYSCVERWFST